MRQAYSDDQGVPADVEEIRLREAQGQAEEAMEIEEQYRDEIVMATNIGTGREASNTLSAQRAVLQLWPHAKVLHARINQDTGEVEK